MESSQLLTFIDFWHQANQYPDAAADRFFTPGQWRHEKALDYLVAGLVISVLILAVLAYFRG